MKKYILVLIVVMALAMLCGCSTRKSSIVCSGEFVTKEYTNLEGTDLTIEDIYIKKNEETIPVKVFINKGTEKKIVVTAQQEVIDSLKVKAKKGDIKIKGSATKFYDTESIKIEVYGYKLESANLEFASGEIDGTSVDKEFDLDVSHKSNIKLKEMNGEELDINVSGNSLVTLSLCTTTEISIDASGDSEVNAVNVEASSLDIDFSGFSKGTIYANSGNAKINLSGTSSLTIIGNTGKLEVNESGSSSLLASELSSETAEINCSGASVCNACVNTTISYNLSGSSYLKYIGQPEIKDQTLTGGSSVENGK